MKRSLIDAALEDQQRRIARRAPVPIDPELPVSENDKRKQSLYFPAEILEEMKTEAARLDRSLSWVAQQAWKISREKLRDLPAPPRA